MAEEDFMELYDLFAHILEPPGPPLSDQVNECISILASSQWEAAGLMNRFTPFILRCSFGSPF